MVTSFSVDSGNLRWASRNPEDSCWVAQRQKVAGIYGSENELRFNDSHFWSLKSREES